MSWDGRAPTRRLGRRRCSGGSGAGGSGCSGLPVACGAAPVAQCAERGRHLVQWRRGDHEQAEAGEQEQHRDGEPRGQALLQRVAEQEADQAALRVGGGAAAHDVQHAEGAERQRQPADDEAAEAAGTVLRVVVGRGPRSGGVQDAPRPEQQEQGQQQGALAEGRRQRAVDRGTGAAGPPPGAAGADEGEHEQQEREAVAPVRRVDALGASPQGTHAAGGQPARPGDQAEQRPDDDDDLVPDLRREAGTPGRRAPRGARLAGVRFDVAVDRPPLPLRGRVVVVVRLAMAGRYRSVPPVTAVPSRTRRPPA